MNRKVNVMGSEDFNEIGIFFYCVSDDIHLQNKPELLHWFDGAKKIVLEDKNEFEIIAIEPMMSQFTNQAAFLIKVDTNNIPVGIYPITAIIE